MLARGDGLLMTVLFGHRVGAFAVSRMTETESDDGEYRVVRNADGQFSIMRKNHPNPAGWHDEGMRGSKEECLDHIETVWTDMAPNTAFGRGAEKQLHAESDREMRPPWTM